MGGFEVIPVSIYGTSSIGAYVFTNNELTILPPDAPAKVARLIEEALGTRVLKLTIAKSPLVGIFIVGNDSGVLVPSIVEDEELLELRRSGLNVLVVKTRYTAIANLVLTNNRSTVVSPILEKDHLREIGDALGTEVLVNYICGTYLVGSIGVANNRGVLLSPEASEEDVRKIREIFKVNVDVGTINRGRSFIRGGLVVNDRGGIVGNETTGFEIIRIMQVLGSTQGSIARDTLS
jgi:translation initiation factor 6